MTDTLDPSEDESNAPVRRDAGLLVVLSSGKPTWQPIRLGRDGMVIGREGDGLALPDGRVSQRHARVRRREARWTVEDLGSRNGTFVDGVPITSSGTSSRGASAQSVVRLGSTLVLLVEDVDAYRTLPVPGPQGPVVGPRLATALAEIAHTAASGGGLLIHGESGSGKELAARHFLGSGPNSSGPFVAVNCATIPEGIAERLLFGAVRGAYSGVSADVDGHIQAADGGVLFLDEVAELDLGVQAKLLRVIETREVARLGGVAARRVNIRICAATHRDLRAAVAEGRFRADLYYRLATPSVTLPALRERRDEIAWHVCQAITGFDSSLVAHAKLVEACLLRRWPGNVRELHRELGAAAFRAQAQAVTEVRLTHLAPSAGCELDSTSRSALARAAPTREDLTREDIVKALEDGGSLAAAARILRLHRNQLYRELARHGIARPAR